MAESTVVSVPRDGSITITNGDATSYVVNYENGDFSYNEDKAERITIFSRGSIVGLRSGNDPIPTLSFTVHLRELMNSSADTLLDFISKTNNSSGATSTGGTGYEPFLVDLVFKTDSIAVGGSSTKVTCSKVLLFASVSEGSPDQIAISGEIYGGTIRAAG